MRAQLEALIAKWVRSATGYHECIADVRALLASSPETGETGWQPIATAPRSIIASRPMISGSLSHEYGPRLLAYPVAGEVARVRWWQVSDGSAGNFLDDGGNAVHPDLWMPLPSPPAQDQP